MWLSVMGMSVCRCEEGVLCPTKQSPRGRGDCFGYPPSGTARYAPLGLLDPRNDTLPFFLSPIFGNFLFHLDHLFRRCDRFAGDFTLRVFEPLTVVVAADGETLLNRWNILYLRGFV